MLKNVFTIGKRKGVGRVKPWHLKPLADQDGFNYTELLSIHMNQQLLERSGSEDLQTIPIPVGRECTSYVQGSARRGNEQLFVQDDGTLYADFQLPDAVEIKRWVMSCGPREKALGPANLIEDIQSELAAMFLSDARETVQ